MLVSLAFDPKRSKHGQRSRVKKWSAGIEGANILADSEFTADSKTVPRCPATRDIAEVSF